MDRRNRSSLIYLFAGISLLLHGALLVWLPPVAPPRFADEGLNRPFEVIPWHAPAGENMAPAPPASAVAPLQPAAQPAAEQKPLPNEEVPSPAAIAKPPAKEVPAPPPPEPQKAERTREPVAAPSASPVEMVAPEEPPAPVEETRIDPVDRSQAKTSAELPSPTTATPVPSVPPPSTVAKRPASRPAVSPPSPRQAELRQEYLESLRRLIARNRRYPLPARRAGRQGTAVVKFTIERTGRLRHSDLLRSSGQPLLDRAALATVESVGTFPPLPDELDEDRLTCELPIEFSLSR